MRSKRVDVMYSFGGSKQMKCMTGKKTVILMQSDDEAVDVTAVNVENMDDVCEVLEDALNEARRARSSMQSRPLKQVIANC